MGQRVAASVTPKHCCRLTGFQWLILGWLNCSHLLGGGTQHHHCAAGYKAPTGAPSLAGTVLTVVENTDQASRCPAHSSLQSLYHAGLS